MIIYNGAKYSCASCIRGHRSSTCRHTKRMLVKVRTRGRPSPIDIRDVIMVDPDFQVKNKSLQECRDGSKRYNSEEDKLIPEDEDNDTNGKKPGCANNKMMTAQPILFVKARQTKKAMLVDGKLNIIMDEQNNIEQNNTLQKLDNLENNDDDANDSSIDDNERAKRRLNSMTYMSEKDYIMKHGNESQSSGLTSLSGNVNMTSNMAPVKRELSNTLGVGNDNKRKCCDPNHIRQLPDILSEDNSKVQSLFGNPFFGNDFSTTDVSPTTSISTTNISNHTNSPSLAASELFTDIFDPKNDTVDMFTHKGIYLSADCSCNDDDCSCLNCLIHRNEEELNKYIQNSGVPLTNLRSSDFEIEEKPSPCCSSGCNCTLTECSCVDCTVHPTEIMPFEKFYFKGILNVKLRRKTVIKYNNKLIPSKYWWNFLTVKIPSMTDAQLESIDMKNWFDKLLTSHHNELLDAQTDDFPFNDLEGFYVI